VAVLEDDLSKTKKTFSSALTKLILRVKKLEARVKIGKARRNIPLKSFKIKEAVRKEVLKFVLLMQQKVLLVKFQ
ncbi:hypothetical protein Tco_0338811, partial [Tanacetum coccineum]